MQNHDLHLKYPPTPENAPKMAELAVGAVASTSGEALDYTPDSLESVDQLVGRLASGNDLASVGETLFCLGCYVGEVLVRNLGGRWLKREDSRMKQFSRWPLLVEMEDGHTWNPIGKAFKRFELGEAEGIPRLFEAARAAAATER